MQMMCQLETETIRILFSKVRIVLLPKDPNLVLDIKITAISSNDHFIKIPSVLMSE